MPPNSVFAPAKLNLFLAITGRRADGFHELVSLVAPLEFGDTLVVEPAKEFSLRCDDPNLAVDESNLVLKAARAFAAAAKYGGGASFSLQKRIPIGAGLGGGSSNAVAALRALNQLAGSPLSEAALGDVAAAVGSDCPLFLAGGPAIIRGRGERVEPLPAAAARRLHGQRVLVFKPGFSVATAWAYARIAATPRPEPHLNPAYVPASVAESQLQAWLGNESAPLDSILFNNLERPVFTKYLALPELLVALQGEFGIVPRMSGSGSACFALLSDTPSEPVVAAIRRAWGESAFVLETRLA